MCSFRQDRRREVPCFSTQPVPGGAELHPGAVHEQMQRTGSEPSAQRHGQRPGPAAQGRVVWHREIQPKQVNDGADQPFGLPERQTARSISAVVIARAE